MRPIRNILIYGLLCAALFFPLHASAAAGEPLEVVKGAAEKAIQILKDPKLQAKDKQKERVDRLREVLSPIFDYEEMAKRALGIHWRSRTPAEQEEFARLFRNFIERVYADKIDLYKGEKVVFGRETLDKDFAQVESTMVGDKNEEFSVIYRLRQNNGKWKVYDAVIENISIVNNYRAQFDRVINGSSYQELVKKIKDKAG